MSLSIYKTNFFREIHLFISQFDELFMFGVAVFHDFICQIPLSKVKWAWPSTRLVTLSIKGRLTNPMRPSWSWRVLCLLDSEVRKAVEHFLLICSHCLVNIYVWKFRNYVKDFNQSLWSLCGLTQRIPPPYNLQGQKCIRRGCHNAGEGPSSLPLHHEWLSPAHWLWQVSLTDKLMERCNTKSCNDISILHERNLCFN